ncbi:MAG: hypothetical protein AAGF01_03605 [Cyanobacteria bacterium P01_G01_bin.38]
MASSSQITLTTVAEGLTLKTVDNLKRLLKLLPTKERPTKKADLVSLIATYLAGPGLKKSWQGLDELQQAAVAEAVYVTGGFYLSDQFQAKYGQSPEWRNSSYYSYNQPAAKLNLFFYSQGYGYGYIIPEDMQAQLRAFVPEPKPLELERSEQPPQTMQVERRYFDYEQRKSVHTQEELPVVCCEMERVAQQDLLAILRFVHLGKVAVSDKTLMPTKATVNAIAPLLQGGDYYTDADSQPQNDYQQPIGAIKPFAWPMILQGAGLATLDGKKLQLTAAGQKALNADPAKTIKAIWKKWLKTRVLDELRRVDAIKGQMGKGKRGLTALDKRRSVIAQALKDCPVGQWVNFEDLTDYMIASDQTFEVSRHPQNLYISEAGYGNLYDAGGSWSILETSYMQCLLFEYAATLGLIDVAYVNPYDAPGGDWTNFWGADDLSFLSRYDGLLAIRLTSLGAFCLGLEATYTAPAITTETTLQVLPNLDIVITGQPLNPGENLLMDTFTQKTADAVWKLDRDAILKATAEGHSLKEFQDFLVQASAHALPKTVQQFFKDCLSRSESLQDMGLARLIECADATLATLIAHDSRTKKYCQLAGDRHLVVPLEDENRFRTGLRKLGYTLPLGKG